MLQKKDTSFETFKKTYHIAMSMGLLELQQLEEHAIPLFVIVPLHFILDLPFKPNRFETSQTFRC